MSDIVFFFINLFYLFIYFIIFIFLSLILLSWSTCPLIIGPCSLFLQVLVRGILIIAMYQRNPSFCRLFKACHYCSQEEAGTHPKTNHNRNSQTQSHKHFLSSFHFFGSKTKTTTKIIKNTSIFFSSHNKKIEIITHKHSYKAESQGMTTIIHFWTEKLIKHNNIIITADPRSNQHQGITCKTEPNRNWNWNR